MGSRESAMEYLSSLPTGFVADALGKMNLFYTCTQGVWPVRGFEDAHVAGPAVTVKYAPMRPTGARPKIPFFDILEFVKPGSVICVEAAPDLCFTGDNQANMAKKAGAAGIVLSGGARDIAGLRQVGLPVWAMQPAVRLMSSQYELVALNESIEIGGVVVSPGDLVIADEDGAVVVPAELVERTADVAREVAEIEEKLEALVNSGGTPAEVGALYTKKGAKVPIKQ